MILSCFQKKGNSELNLFVTPRTALSHIGCSATHRASPKSPNPSEQVTATPPSKPPSLPPPTQRRAFRTSFRCRCPAVSPISTLSADVAVLSPPLVATKASCPSHRRHLILLKTKPPPTQRRAFRTSFRRRCPAVSPISTLSADVAVLSPPLLATKASCPSHRRHLILLKTNIPP
ncbi:hypothetical protein PIB30_046512, partial [Stylosanthes scabra]|nr:hypothetical protein [Stylosanthes scabra]